MIVGNSDITQIAIEDTYGVLKAPTHQVYNVKSEFDVKYNKANTGEKTGARAAGPVSTMGISSTGNINLGTRPDEVGKFLLLGLGVKSASVELPTGVFTTTFTAIGTDEDDHLPSASVVTAKGGIAKGYTGLKMDSFDFSAEPEKHLFLDASFVGKDEVAASLTGGLTPSVKKTYRFDQGAVKVAGTKVADINSIKFHYGNNLITGRKTTDTGLYSLEPEAGLREITVDFTMEYSTAAELLRTTYYKTDDIFELELKFISTQIITGTTPYSLTFTIPNAQITECTQPSAGVSEGSTQTVKATAVEDNGDELIEVVLVSSEAE